MAAKIVSGLEELKTRFNCIADIRGLGLYIDVFVGIQVQPGFAIPALLIHR